MSENRVAGRSEEKMWTDDQNTQFKGTLEEFFEVNNVDMGSVSSWRDTELAAINSYDFLGWFNVDAFFTMPALKIDTSFKRESVILREEYDFSRSMYWSWGGSFRYDLPV